MTPERAWENAQAWRVWAQSRTGPERAYGTQAADYWAAEYFRLSGRPMPTLAGPPGDPRQGGTGYQQGQPAYGQPGYGQPGYGQPGYGQPGYGQPGYPQPYAYPPSGYQGFPPHGYQPPPAGYRPPGASRGLVVSMVVIGCIVLAVVLGLGARSWDQWFGTPSASSTTQSAQLPHGGPGTDTDPLDPGSGSGDPGAGPTAAAGTSLEAQWKAGKFALDLPDPVPTTRSQPATFIPGFATPEQWLADANPAYRGIRVVFTDDPDYNCGVDWVLKNGNMADGAAGCYRPVYPKVLFIYWGENTSTAMREFVLAHELSHLIQWWDHFDVKESALKAGLADDRKWYTINETDATCRVLSWGGYDEQVANRSSSPCTTDDWSEDWLAQQATAMGVEIKDF